MTTEQDEPRPPSHCGREMRTSYEQRDKWWCPQCGERIAKGSWRAPVSWADVKVAFDGVELPGFTNVNPIPWPSKPTTPTPRTPTEALDVLASIDPMGGSLVRQARIVAACQGMNADDEALGLLRSYCRGDALDTVDRVLAGGDP